MTLLEKIQSLLDSGASAEDIQGSLGEYMVPKETFNKVNNENKELKEYKTKYSESKEKVTTLSSELETLKTSSMNETELMKHELEKAQGIIKDNNIKSNRLEAMNEFIKNGYKEEEFTPLLDKFVSEDAEKTKDLVASVISLTGSKVKKAKEDTVDDLLDNNKLPEGDEPETPTVDQEAFLEGLEKVGY